MLHCRRESRRGQRFLRTTLKNRANLSGIGAAAAGASPCLAHLVGGRIVDCSHSGAITVGEENQWVTFQAELRGGWDRDFSYGREVFRPRAFSARRPKKQVKSSHPNPLKQHPAINLEIIVEPSLIGIVAQGFDAGVRYEEHLVSQ